MEKLNCLQNFLGCNESEKEPQVYKIVRVKESTHIHARKPIYGLSNISFSNAIFMLIFLFLERIKLYLGTNISCEIDEESSQEGPIPLFLTLGLVASETVKACDY